MRLWSASARALSWSASCCEVTAGSLAVSCVSPHANPPEMARTSRRATPKARCLIVRCSSLGSIRLSVGLRRSATSRLPCQTFLPGFMRFCRVDRLLDRAVQAQRRVVPLLPEVAALDPAEPVLAGDRAAQRARRARTARRPRVVRARELPRVARVERGTSSGGCRRRRGPSCTPRGRGARRSRASPRSPRRAGRAGRRCPRDTLPPRCAVTAIETPSRQRHSAATSAGAVGRVDARARRRASASRSSSRTARRLRRACRRPRRSPAKPRRGGHVRPGTPAPARAPARRASRYSSAAGLDARCRARARSPRSPRRASR